MSNNQILKGMKKITLFGALLVAGMATAQVNSMTSENLKVEGFQFKTLEATATLTNEEFTAESYANRYAKKAASANYDGVDYYYADGMMFAGADADGGMYIPLIMLPYQETTVWKNQVQSPVSSSWEVIKDVATTWYQGDELLAENSVTCETEYGICTMSAPLQTYDHTLNVDGTNYSIKGYKFGDTETSQYVVSAVGADMLTDGYLPLTLCNTTCDAIWGTEGGNLYRVGAGSYGPYANGCGLTIEGSTIDTIGSIVRNVSTMKIEQINLLVYNSDQQGIDVMVPEGAEIKVEIFAADVVAGQIDRSEALYTTTITAADYTEIAPNGIGTLSAIFYEEDIFGGLQQVPIYIEGDFYIQFTNFNESNCHFGFYSDYYTPAETTLFTWNGKLTTLWSGGGSNILISYDAYWPVVVPVSAEEVLVAPVEGGIAMDGEYSAIALYSNVADVESNWIFDIPEWIEVEYDESTWDSQGYVVAQFNAAALPAEIEGRQGIVTIEADGYVCEVVINQGEVVNTAVDNVVAPEFNGKTFNLLGVEVDENYKGIVIKNGQKYIQ